MVRIRDPILKVRMSALVAGMVGVMVASYGNAVLGTMPTAVSIYMSMALLMNTNRYDSKTENGEVNILPEKKHSLSA
jgi:energy-converting hydrogenase Eha subunit C